MKLGISGKGFRRLAQISVGPDFQNDLEIAEDESGMLTLYHFTSPESADQIVDAQRFKSLENTGDAYFTSRVDSDASSFGEALIEIEVPVSFVTLNDEFPSGEVHVTIAPKHQQYITNLKRIAKRNQSV